MVLCKTHTATLLISTGRLISCQSDGMTHGKSWQALQVAKNSTKKTIVIFYSYSASILHAWNNEYLIIMLQTMPSDSAVSDTVNKIPIFKVNVHMDVPLFSAAIGSM